MASWIKSVKVFGLHGRVSVGVELKEGLNIVHGRNGVGKTTFLHILTNLLERDIERFCYIGFKEISVTLGSGSVINLIQEGKGRDRVIVLEIDGIRLDPIQRGEPVSGAVEAALEPHFGGRPVYLPAFRTMLEGTMKRGEPRSFLNTDVSKAQFEQVRRRELEKHSKKHRYHFYGDPSESVAAKTIMCREWFGSFVPVVRYPSLHDLSNEIGNELQSALLELSRFDQAALSTVFVEVIQSVFIESPITAVDSIEHSVANLRTTLAKLKTSRATAPEAYQKINEFFDKPFKAPAENELLLKSILSIYLTAANKRIEIQSQAFGVLNRFEASVNKFLDGKKLEIGEFSHRYREDGPLIRFNDESKHPLSVLSSGERHLITLLFCATHMSDRDGIVLIDEPELSLHIDWQRIILSELQIQTGERQVIVCTHASEIAGDHRSHMTQLRQIASNIPSREEDSLLPEDDELVD